MRTLSICSPSRFKGGNISSYFFIKAIAEELRGLAVEFNVPIFSATQTTRTGFVSTDIGLEDTSESFGLPATADFMFALISNEECFYEIDGVEWHMEVGKIYEIDNTRWHSCKTGNQDRTHLIINLYP